MRILLSCMAGAALCLASCSKPPESLPPLPSRARPKAPLRDPGVPSLHATEIGRVPGATYGPYLAARADGGLVVWAANEGNERRFQSVALSATGRPLKAAQLLAPAPAEMGVVLVRPLSSGYALLYTRQEPSREETLEALCTSAEGLTAKDQKPATTSLPARALWVEAVPVAGGALVFYATRSNNARAAEVRVRRLDASCRFGEAELLEGQALAWQATAFAEGAQLTAMRPGTGNNRSVWSTSVTNDGKIKRSVTVVGGAEVELDLDAAYVDSHLLVAFTDHRSLDPHISIASLDSDQKLVREPTPLTAKEGEQALVRLVSEYPGAKQGYVAFERFTGTEPGRHISLSALDGEGRLKGRRVELAYDREDGIPDFVASAGGLAVVTSTKPCPKRGECGDQPVVPLFVSFDAALTPLASEPLRLDALQGKVAELAVGLACTGSGCFGVAALTRVPAPLYVTELAARSDVWKAPLAPPARNIRPRVLEHEAVTELESLAGFAVAQGNPDKYLAYVTDFDSTTPWKRLTKPAADGRFEPLRAKVGVEVGVNNGPQPYKAASFSPISLRAQSLANVALAPSQPSSGDVLMAWGGVDNGRAQVFATLIGKGGVKRAQRMLTHGTADVADIALAFVGDGWVVAWVDERSSDPEVYAQKLDSKLNLVGTEQRITRVPGAALDLALQFDGKSLLLAWSDAQASPESGDADIYVQRLRPKDAAPDGSALRVSETPAHSYGPSLAATPSGFSVAWIERGREGERSSVALAELNADFTVERSTAPTIPGDPRALALDCSSVGSCHLVILAEVEDGAVLYGAIRTGKAFSKIEPLIGLDGSALTSVRPVLSGDNLFFADRAETGTRIRRAHLEW
ncbi:MAG TPA: hypothetical protein VFQ61_25355 [Polyangiaceae bacterium]|nr:hypothetical protein [Polyangiaceae bacterium]